MPKRRATPAAKSRPSTSPTRVSLGLVALALALRLAGIRWGVPDGTHFFSFHPDEFETAGRAIRILNTGNWDPEFFNYGSLYLYLTTLVSWPLYALHIVQTVTGTHVMGRIVSAVLGAATVLVTERIGRRFLDVKHARFAAFLVAIAPGHVLHSTFATVDATATFLVALSIWLALRAREGASWRRWALAGAAAGLAGGTKYASGLVILITFAAALWAPGISWRRRVLCAGLFKVAAIVAFVVAVPYAFVTPDLFRDDVTYELFVHPLEGHRDYFTSTGDGWSYHLVRNLPYVLGPPLMIASLAGLGLWFVKRRAETTLMLVFVLPYFAGLGLSNVRFLRYTLPLVPPFALAASATLAWLAAKRPGLTQDTSRVLVAWASILTAIQIFAMVQPDARTRAARWVFANVPPGSTVGLPSIPWFATPTVTPWNGGERSRQHFLREAAPWRFVLCEEWDVEALEQARPAVFLMSEFETRDARRLNDPDAGAFLAALGRDYTVAARFGSIRPAWRVLFGPPFAPHDWLYPFAEITVWRRK